MSRDVLLRFGLLGSLLCGAALGQVNDEIYGALDFNFSTPGARSLGMGNAFVGLVDDATAAYANPAGLPWLEKPEVAAELRNRQFKTSFVDGGNFSGTPSGIGLDNRDTPRYSTTTTSTTDIGYLSWVYPGERWSFALYRQEAANFRGKIAGSQGAFLGLENDRLRISPLTAELDLELVDYGIAGGWKLTSSFWVGLGVSYQLLDLASRSTAYDSFEVFDPANGIFEASFEPTSFPEEDIVNINSSSSFDSDLTATLGWLWRQARWSIGGIYRRGATFDLEYAVALGQAGRGLSERRGVVPEDVEAALTGATEFRVPHVWAFGGAWRPTDSWTISMEVDWIEYSRLSPSANVQISGIDLRDPELAEVPGALESYRVDDGAEYHLGFEYAVLGRKSYALRFGSWWEPDHSIRYIGDVERIKIRFSGGEDVFHLDAGAGMALRDGQWQLDFAVDHSDHGTIATLSMVCAY